MRSVQNSGEVHKRFYCNRASYSEHWRPHEASQLWVSNIGRIKKNRNDTPKYGYRSGYKQKYRMYYYQGKAYYVHKLVLETWHKETKPTNGRGMAVWLDGDCCNNVADNLKWKIPKQRPEPVVQAPLGS